MAERTDDIYSMIIELIDKTATRIDRTTYRLKNRKIIMLRYSKLHKNGNYWFGFGKDKFESYPLEEFYILFICGTEHQVIVTPALYLKELLKEVKTAADNNWKINIFNLNDRFEILATGKSKEDISLYLNNYKILEITSKYGGEVKPLNELKEIVEKPIAVEDEPIGTLYIVATPIGNLEDITLRALRVLKEVDLIAAEDTRHTRQLLSHFGIRTPLISYHAHNQASRGPELIRRLEAGENVALVSDAGTPGFSDPGADLVARAWEAGVRVEAIPGPAAGVAALSLSGFKGDILFVGFLPRGEGRRLKMFQALAPESRVIIMYESPRRLARTLTEIAGSMPRREVLVVRELTKKFEETWRGPVADIARKLQDTEIRGECALVLSCPAAAATVPPADLAGRLLKAAGESGLQGRRLADRVAGDLKLPRRQVYQTYLALKEQGRVE